MNKKVEIQKVKARGSSAHLISLDSIKFYLRLLFVIFFSLLSPAQRLIAFDWWWNTAT